MPRRRVLHLTFAVVAIVFFATPLALRAVGVRAHAFENRRLAAAPKLADGWDFFDEATRFLIDRMPLREQAVHANTWIDLHVFNTTPQYGTNGLGGVSADAALPFAGQPDQDKAAIGGTQGSAAKGTYQPPATADQVVVGLDGWYFLQGVFVRACTPFIPFTEAMSRWEALLRVIRASGRHVIFIVPPDKSTVYPEYVAPSTPELACARKGTAALWHLIDSPGAAAAGVIGLLRPLLALKRVSPVPIYFRTDSHWNNIGSLTFVEAILKALSKHVRVLPREIVNPGSVRYSGDLLALLGQPGSELAPRRYIERAKGAPVISTPTVIVGDSYADVSLPQVSPYFGRLKFIYWFGSSTRQLLNAVAGARNVVLEVVEREFDYHASNPGIITPRFIALMREALAKHPLPR